MANTLGSGSGDVIGTNRAVVVADVIVDVDLGDGVDEEGRRTTENADGVVMG